MMTILTSHIHFLQDHIDSSLDFTKVHILPLKLSPTESCCLSFSCLRDFPRELGLHTMCPECNHFSLVIYDSKENPGLFFNNPFICFLGWLCCSKESLQISIFFYPSYPIFASTECHRENYCLHNFDFCHYNHIICKTFPIFVIAIPSATLWHIFFDCLFFYFWWLILKSRNHLLVNIFDSKAANLTCCH